MTTPPPSARRSRRDARPRNGDADAVRIRPLASADYFAWTEAFAARADETGRALDAHALRLWAEIDRAGSGYGGIVIETKGSIRGYVLYREQFEFAPGGGVALEVLDEAADAADAEGLRSALIELADGRPEITVVRWRLPWEADADRKALESIGAAPNALAYELLRQRSGAFTRAGH